MDVLIFQVSSFTIYCINALIFHVSCFTICYINALVIKASPLYILKQMPHVSICFRFSSLCLWKKKQSFEQQNLQSVHITVYLLVVNFYNVENIDVGKEGQVLKKDKVLSTQLKNAPLRIEYSFKYEHQSQCPRS